MTISIFPFSVHEDCTLQKKEVWAQLFVPVKRFKICHTCRKRNSFFRFSIPAFFSFYFMNALVYVNIEQGIHKKKLKKAGNEERTKKNYMGFLIHKIWQIFKRHSRAICWAQTSYFWGVTENHLLLTNLIVDLRVVSRPAGSLINNHSGLQLIKNYLIIKKIYTIITAASLIVV